MGCEARKARRRGGGTRVGFRSQTRLIWGGALKFDLPSVGRLTSVPLPLNTHFCCDPIYFQCCCSIPFPLASA